MARRAFLSTALLLLVGNAVAQDPATCGQAGQPCCCSALDWTAPRCCATGTVCTVFGGQGFGVPAKIEALCVPKASEACGSDGGRCCLGPNSSGFITGTCNGTDVACIPGPTPFNSRAQYDKLTGGASAARDASVTGTCRKSFSCNTAYNPCGKAAGCGTASCPSGFYCASSYDSGVGDVCLPLPADAGKAGGSCLPANFEGAPIAESTLYAQTVKAAAPFCSGSAICFTPIGGDTTGFNLGKASDARDLSARITGTKCVEVPADCGSGLGKPCCPSTLNMLTDKPLPSAAWGGDACNPAKGKHGTFCRGAYHVLSGQPLGICVANVPCGGPDEPCCRYSKSAMAGVSCPKLGGPGAGYCDLNKRCKLCPAVAYQLQDIIRCY